MKRRRKWGQRGLDESGVARRELFLQFQTGIFFSLCVYSFIVRDKRVQNNTRVHTSN